MSHRYDLISVGGGTAGLIASLGVAGIGGRAALVERGRTGGDCLWTGCVPSKALLAAASAAHLMRTADRHGLEPAEPEVDLARVMAAVRRAQAAVAPHDSPDRLRAEGITVVAGDARFEGPGRIRVGQRTLRYRSALIAVGARPLVPQIDGLPDARPLTSDTIWGLDTLPSRLVVLGGGPIGCELGQAFARLGSAVTIVETAATLVPREAPVIGEFLAQRFEVEGITVHTSSRAIAVHPGEAPAGEGGGPGEATPWLLQLDDGSTVGFDRILVATGRTPNTTDLGLDTVGVEVDESGHVVVDERMRTSGRQIFAAGDVTGRMPFTHVAAHQARQVVTNAMFRTRSRVDYQRLPWVTFTDPEIARVGLDAAAARRRWGEAAVIQRFEYADLDRAVAQAEPHGWAELVADPERRLLGATIVGEAAGESIAELVAWIETERRIDDVSSAVHAYPTFSEGPSRAAHDVMRARFFTPRVRAVTRPLLGLLRQIDRP